MSGAGAGRFSLPAGAAVYRSIGPFDRAGLPKGLLREHRLKEGAWGRLRVLSGEIGFVWDDAGAAQDAATLAASASIVIPPGVPHHLEPLGSDFLLEIDFLEAAA